MLGLVFLERPRACARPPRPPGSARAGRRVTGEEIMQELREMTSRLVNIATGGCLSRELPGEHRPRERWSVMSYGRRRGLRPVSPYVIVLALAVALTASFFLPLRAEAAISNHTVPTISPSGTTINLFDYWVNPDNHLSVSGNGGINKNHRFQFKDQGASEELNRYTGGSWVRTGIVNNVLAGGYPKLTGRWEGESLGYLFDSSVQTGKISHMGVTGLLQAKGGYYEYDSSLNYAAYNANKNAFDVYNAAGVMQAGAEPHSVASSSPSMRPMRYSRKRTANSSRTALRRRTTDPSTIISASPCRRASCSRRMAKRTLASP